MRSEFARVLTIVAAGLSAAACDPILGPSSPDTNWRVHVSGQFTFYVRPGSFAETNLDTLGTVLDDQFQVTLARLDLTYHGQVTMYLHNSGAEAGFGKDSGGGDHSGVAYPETETAKVACVPPLDANLFSLVSHEANHVIIGNGLGRPGTSFVNEGLASAVLSERYHSLGPSFYYRWTSSQKGRLPRLADLLDDDRWQAQVQFIAYNTSASFLAYLIATYGSAPLKAIYYAPASSFADKFRQAYGRSLEQAEAEWLAFCDRQG
jgi:hypothetical protein